MKNDVLTSGCDSRPWLCGIIITSTSGLIEFGTEIWIIAKWNDDKLIEEKSYVEITFLRIAFYL